MNHAQEAQRLFLKGYNCAQAVFCAFCDVTGMDLNEAARLSAPFGGGMGRLREVCGTVSGALLALGALQGYADPQDPAAKAAHYRQVQTFARRFEAENGALRCRDLLKNVPVTPGGTPEPRTPEFYARRPCLRLVGAAAAQLDALLAELQSTETKEASE